mgnify:CR=1 FL=1
MAKDQRRKPHAKFQYAFRFTFDDSLVQIVKVERNSRNFVLHAFKKGDFIFFDVALTSAPKCRLLILGFDQVKFSPGDKR